MNIIENTKEIANLIKKIGNIDLSKRIVELEGQIIDFSQEKHQLEVRLHELETVLKEEKSMEFRKPFYYRPADSQPYCAKCWELNRKAIHLDGPIKEETGESYFCHVCREDYYPK